MKKILSILLYIFATASLLILVKTEIRKYFTLEGDPSPANTVIFWGALILFLIFFYAANKLWPKKSNSIEKNYQPTNKSL